MGVLTLSGKEGSRRPPLGIHPTYGIGGMRSSFSFRPRKDSAVIGLTARRILALLCVGLGLSGCMGALQATSPRPVHCEPPQVLMQTDFARYRQSRLGILLFEVPPYASEAAPEVTDAYYRELLSTGLFRTVKILPYTVKNDQEALWWARSEGWDLLMRSGIQYLLDGSGALPTHIEVRTRILDVRTGQPIWEVLQKAYSEPGADVDLFWTTVPGKPAQRYRLLSSALGVQLAQMLIPPEEKTTRPMRSK